MRADIYPLQMLLMTVSGWVNRHQADVIAYLIEENRRERLLQVKSILGDRLRARHPRAQRVEAMIACHIRNQMAELGRSVSVAIGR